MRPIIGITAGDPAGIGLEVTIKALQSELPAARWVIFTDRVTFEQNMAIFGGDLPIRWIGSMNEITDEPVVFLNHVADGCPIAWGDVDPEAGRRAFGYLRAASDSALGGEIAGIVTAPVSKEAIGGAFVGQTDALAGWAGVSRFAMAFFAPTLKVVLATIHLSLREALNRIRTDQYVDLIRFTHEQFLRFQFPSPRIAVAAVNPHAGEGGMFGREEIDILTPAVNQCRNQNINVSGPHSADSLYYRAHTGEFDVVIAPYHDQGLVPIKLIAHGESTNVTLGLPYVRTSPDHGTAFEIAGRGKADPSAMRAALRCAVDLIDRQGKRK